MKLLTHSLTLVSFNNVREQLRRGEREVGERGRKVKSGELAGKETQGKYATVGLEVDTCTQKVEKKPGFKGDERRNK